MTDETTEVSTTAITEEEEDDAEDSQNAQSDDDISARWLLFGTVCPKEEIVFLCQVVVLNTTILTSIYNLTTGPDNSNLWKALLTS